MLGIRLDGTFDLDDAIPETGVGDECVKEEKNKDGTAKKRLLRQLARVMRELPNRQKRLDEMKKKDDEEKIKMAVAQKVAASGVAGNKKKKGKKKSNKQLL